MSRTPLVDFYVCDQKKESISDAKSQTNVLKSIQDTKMVQGFLVACAGLYSHYVGRSVCRSVHYHFVFLYFLMILSLFLGYFLKFYLFF